MVNFLMVRRRACAVSNHEAAITRPSRRGEDAAPQDEAETVGWAKRSVPTIQATIGINGGHGARAPLPTLHCQPIHRRIWQFMCAHRYKDSRGNEAAN